ncbi:MAG: GntR family transcriptional regulator [Anaerolineae bacterium]|nr:GntR family transcriptional regulator [Anaerolineae bacterium]
MSELKGGAAAPVRPYIDRDSDQPVYVQLADILRQQISAGAFRPGEQLPSEAMLVRTYQVSPMTVRRAINLLTDQNVVTTVQGRGTFVKAVQLGAAAFDLSDLQAMFSDDAVVKLVEARFVAADERTARKLQIEVGEYAIYIRRLLLIHNEPAFYHRGYLIYDPTRPIVESELEVTVLKGLFDGTGSPLIKRGELSMEAALLTEEEAAILQVSLPAAGWLLEHRFFDFDDKPVSWGWFVCHGDRFRLHTKIGLE